MARGASADEYRVLRDQLFLGAFCAYAFPPSKAERVSTRNRWTISVASRLAWSPRTLSRLVYNIHGVCRSIAFIFATNVDPSRIVEAEVLGLIAGIGINNYSPPGPSEPYPASGCMCSSVLYSLLAACGLCQGFTYLSYVCIQRPCAYTPSPWIYQLVSVDSCLSI